MAFSSRLYTTLAFVAGILLTLGYKDVYPDLERRFRRRLRRATTVGLAREHQVGDELRIDGDTISLAEERSISSTSKDGGFTEQGIEACIGKTPLFKIKSLSEQTGCEILAKAEVYTDSLEPQSLFKMPNAFVVLEWWWW